MPRKGESCRDSAQSTARGLPFAAEKQTAGRRLALPAASAFRSSTTASLIVGRSLLARTPPGSSPCPKGSMAAPADRRAVPVVSAPTSLKSTRGADWPVPRSRDAGRAGFAHLFAPSLQSPAMQNRWSDSPAGELEQLVHQSRLVGMEEDLVLWGGGNNSVKSQSSDLLGRPIDVMYIKS